MQGGADLHFPNSERWRKKDQKFKVSLPLLSKGKTSQRYKKIFLNTHKKPQSQKKKLLRRKVTHTCQRTVGVGEWRGFQRSHGLGGSDGP